MKNLLFFDKMFTINFLTYIYWAAVVLSVLAGLLMLFNGSFIGLVVLIVGPVCARISSELTIVLFKMNEALQDLRNK